MLTPQAKLGTFQKRLLQFHDIMRPNCLLASPLVTIIPIFGEPVLEQW